MMNPTEIGLIAASHPVGQRAEAIIDLVAMKAYGGTLSQQCADAALLVMTKWLYDLEMKPGCGRPNCACRV